MLTLRILLRSEILDPKEVDHLILGKIDPNPPPIPESLKNFISENIWGCIKALETLKPFA
jgi:hypothetical protein